MNPSDHGGVCDRRDGIKAWADALAGARLTRYQRNALDLMKRARQEDSATDDGIYYGGATFYDSEIAVAYVHFNTADALKDRGLIRFGPHDPDWGTSLELTPEGLRA